MNANPGLAAQVTAGTAPVMESGMVFGPFPPGHCVYIEQCQIYRKIVAGVKMAEFALLRTKAGRPPTIWIVEAKSSSPQPGTGMFQEYIDDIRTKFVNAIALLVAACLGRHAILAEELGATFANLNLAQSGFRLVLVINGCKSEWLPPLQSAMEKALHATTKTWALGATPVAVLTEEMAVRHGLIQTPVI